MSKIQTFTGIKKIATRLKATHKIIVFTNGCFDIIHPGHIAVLTQAKRYGDILIVGLNSDASIKKIKGPKRPILNQRARAIILSALSVVDYVVIFNNSTPLRLISAIRPSVLVKGGDWEKSAIVGSALAKKVVRVKLVRSFSTSIIIDKIKSND